MTSKGQSAEWYFKPRLGMENLNQRARSCVTACGMSPSSLSTWQAGISSSLSSTLPARCSSSLLWSSESLVHVALLLSH